MITATTPYELDENFPNLEGANRLERAMKILNTPKAINKVNTGTFTVKSQQSFSVYTVQKIGDKYQCNCPDCIKNGCECKHILAVKLYLDEQQTRLEHQESKVPRVWTNYNLGQMKEGELFDVLLKELADTVETPVTKTRGRPSAKYSDKIFMAVSKVANMKSLRRSQSSFNDAEKNGEVESAVHFNTISNFLRNPELTPILTNLVRLSASPMAEIETTFSVDSSGFTTSNFNTWCDEKWGTSRHRDYVKAHICSGNITNVITDAIITKSTGEGTGDVSNFVQVLKGTSGRFKVNEIMADAAYIDRDLFAAADDLNAEPFIYFKKNSSANSKGCPAWTNSFMKFMTQHDEFVEHYNKRNNVESTFNALKSKFGERIKSKDFVAQQNELLCKIIAYNISVVISAIFVHDIPAVF